MKKIMFDDRFGLTEAVLSGRKTMTRRIVPEMVNRAYEERPHIIWSEEHESFLVFTGWDDIDPFFIRPRYKPGEVVAVAQCYKDVLEEAGCSGQVHPLVAKAGYLNKMFVRADLMPHSIRISSVRVERLQDISDEDCIREGVFLDETASPCYQPFYTFPGSIDHDTQVGYKAPHEAFDALIDKVSGKGTWNSNPWVFVYEFELIK
ncbi:MAG: hypothetical protein K6A62_04600 [Bacteroidales bacterium]|nr:hypothetical protein [Bacteroidales bacterium]